MQSRQLPPARPVVMRLSLPESLPNAFPLLALPSLVYVHDSLLSQPKKAHDQLSDDCCDASTFLTRNERYRHHMIRVPDWKDTRAHTGLSRLEMRHCRLQWPLPFPDQKKRRRADSIESLALSLARWKAGPHHLKRRGRLCSVEWGDEESPEGRGPFPTQSWARELDDDGWQRGRGALS